MKKKLFIEGMSCEHCVMHVANALKELDSVESVEVNLKGKYAVIDLFKDVSTNTLTGAIEEVGYDLVKVEDLQNA